MENKIVSRLPTVKEMDAERDQHRGGSSLPGLTGINSVPLNSHGIRDTPITVLLGEDDPTDAGKIRCALADTENKSFHVEWVTRLSDVLARLGREVADVVLLDLTLPDGQGIEAFDQVFQSAPNALILVLAGANDEETARQAVQHGAYDYLAKGNVDPHWLSRALRYVVEHRAARDALRDSEARFRAMSDASPLGIFVSDEQGSCVYTNAAYHKISGLTFEQNQGKNWSIAIHPEDRQRVLAEWNRAVQDHSPFQTEFRFLREDGRIVWTRITRAAMRDGMEPNGHVQTVEDISERKSMDFVLRAAEEALFEEKERAQVTLNSIGDAVLTTDIQGNVTYLNLVAETMTGWSCEDALGRPISEVFRIIDVSTRQSAVSPALRAIREDSIVGLAADCVLIRRDGSESSIEDSAAPIHNRDGRVAGAVIVFHDVSQSRAMTQKMSHMARHDFLTGLPNRALLTERIAQSIRLARRHRKRVGLLFLDLDFFKHINDSLGHAVGDRLLQSVGERLTGCVRSSDTVCRQGGDEFVILLSEMEHPQDAADVAEKLLAAFLMPHRIGVHELHVTLSIGISVYPDDSISVETVMQNADTAMYHAKTSGRNNFRFFMADMNTRAVRRLFIESSLRRALDQGEFLLHYQPQIDIATGGMTGAEALIRWMDPDLGLVGPMKFVPIAEECGLIVPIGQWVLREVCRQVREWLDSGLRAVPVAVNISALECRHKSFSDGVALILKETGLPPHYLELELTESILMHDAESSMSVLESLRAMGVKIAIDDFGTGYSSLSYLKRFPISSLKIDRSFVCDMTSDPSDATIVSAVIGMGRNLRLRIIAEGVETQEQLVFLQTHHCDEGQGFHFSHPLAADEFAQLLAAEPEDMPPDN
ncbi:MAG: EAL domain-containing protein [Desulfococcaceae bacterium]|jgi:diguanylate cyclase (GGDEF)-like protein/PAS domain S-box-containing protein|nr:EAL domain-containing protein [Desulfococcaceae bacterium]